MNLRLLFLLTGFIIFLSVNIYSQVPRGIVKEGLKIQSKILGKKVRYTIYLPSDYETSSRYYPVVYMLHGYTDNDIAWIQFGEANATADEGIAQRKIPPMILVMPDGGVSWFINNYNDSVKYEDFFFKEFIPYIESHYRILAEKRFRAIAGLSMGGYGALVYALKHPEMFSSCVAFSAAVFTDKEIIDMKDDVWKEGLGLGFAFDPSLKGEVRITKQFKDNDPLYLFKTLDINKIKSVRYYIDCGDNDFLYRGNSALHLLLRDLDIPHEYRVREGMHSWVYWRSGLLNGLKFIGATFH
ncbi:MAG: alpha/beta hydrolase [Ignavibacteriaceae bacterium]